jgi:N-acetylmuramoyl-L-alanine amidase
VRRPERHLKLRLLDPRRQPLRNESYRLEIDGTARAGRTDGNGALDERLPTGASEARLTIAGVTHVLRLAHLNPMEDTDDDGVSGVQARLQNLGYRPGPADGTLNDQTRAAIRAFRRDHDLPDGDDVTAPLRDKLREQHGC